MSEQTNSTRSSDSRCVDPECDHCAWNEALAMKEQLSADSKVAVTVWIATDRVGSTMTRTVKFDREDWDGWSDSEKGAAVWDEIMNRMMLSWGWHE